MDILLGTNRDEVKFFGQSPDPGHHDWDLRPQVVNDPRRTERELWRNVPSSP